MWEDREARNGKHPYAKSPDALCVGIAAVWLGKKEIEAMEVAGTGNQGTRRSRNRQRRLRHLARLAVLCGLLVISVASVVSLVRSLHTARPRLSVPAAPLYPDPPGIVLHSSMTPGKVHGIPIDADRLEQIHADDHPQWATTFEGKVYHIG